MNSEGVAETLGVVGGLPGTSAGGSLVSKSLQIICIAGMLYMPGTGSASSALNLIPASVLQTNSGLTVPSTTIQTAPIMELRRLSGMTWEQLGRLFNVSRRTVHFWASGKTLNAGNEQKLRRALATILQIDRGSASANRDALFTSRSDGVLPFDLLQAERYSDVVNYLGNRQERRRPELSSLSIEARSARIPKNPSDFMGASQDKIHRDIGKSRTARAVRVRGKLDGDQT